MTKTFPGVEAKTLAPAIFPQREGKAFVADDLGEGLVEAIVSVTNIPDYVGDIVEPGAYADTLIRRTPKACWGHDWKMPVGKVLESVELMPGDQRLPPALKALGAGALKVRVQFNLKSDLGREAYEAVRFFGDETEWSIGYDVNAPFGASRKDASTGLRRLTKVNLYEVSVVLFGAAPHTGTLSIKGLDGDAFEVKGIGMIEIKRPLTPAERSERTRRGWEKRQHALAPVRTVATSPDHAVSELIAGHNTTVKGSDVGAVVDKLADSEPTNLAKLHVAGTRLFDGSDVKIPRDKMPQIPPDKRGAFEKALKDMGVKIESDHVDPRSLLPTQAGMVGSKVGGMVRALKAGKFKLDSESLYVSADGHVLDGHHRWAAGAVLAFDQPDTKIPVTVIHMPIRDLLAMSRKFNADEGIAASTMLGAKSLADMLAPYREPEDTPTGREWFVDLGAVKSLESRYSNR